MAVHRLATVAMLSPCPVCGAGPGKPCRGLTGRALDIIHWSRGAEPVQKWGRR